MTYYHVSCDSDSIAYEATFETKLSPLRRVWGEDVKFAIHSNTKMSRKTVARIAWRRLRELVKTPRSFRLTGLRII